MSFIVGIVFSLMVAGTVSSMHDARKDESRQDLALESRCIDIAELMNRPYADIGLVKQFNDLGCCWNDGRKESKGCMGEL